MKFIHTSDLHIGKIVNGFPMLEDQRAVLAQVVQCAREEQADAVVSLRGYLRTAPWPRRLRCRSSTGF